MHKEGGWYLGNTIREGIPPVNKAGYPFIAGAVGITLFFYFIGWQTLGTIMLLLSVWCYYFFRDPVRLVPEEEGAVISPADGRVQLITEATPPAELDMGDEPLTRISIFLNVFNVHVNRVPVAGTVTRTFYYPGKFLNASLDKASEENERMLVKVTSTTGKEVGFIQIAGLIARRIICDIKEGQEVRAGERYGLIRFGSRVDIFLPKGVLPLVAVGQTAVGGETVIAQLSGKQKARIGVPI